jgi:hypothetical protein
LEELGQRAEKCAAVSSSPTDGPADTVSAGAGAAAARTEIVFTDAGRSGIAAAVSATNVSAEESRFAAGSGSAVRLADAKSDATLRV